MVMREEPFALLIVDDEKQNRLLLTELFRNEYKIIQAKNGAQALEHAINHKPDLILLDVLMPDMDGLAVIRELKRNDLTRHIPVIFITALDSPTDEAYGLELGAADYIAKPFHSSIVMARVRNHLQMVHQRDLLGRLASLDGLTGIHNRRYFDETLAREWRRCQRSVQPLSLVVVDVDFFKKYNDSQGHAAGDRVLQEVAALLQQGARRPGDLVARYGGEEFVILLPETNTQSAHTVAEEVLNKVRERSVPHPDSDVADHITVSMGGVSTVPEQEELDVSFFKRADEALYEAKRDGRNRVVWRD